MTSNPIEPEIQGRGGQIRAVRELAQNVSGYDLWPTFVTSWRSNAVFTFLVAILLVGYCFLWWFLVGLGSILSGFWVRRWFFVCLTFGNFVVLYKVFFAKNCALFIYFLPFNLFDFLYVYVFLVNCSKHYIFLTFCICK